MKLLNSFVYNIYHPIAQWAATVTFKNKSPLTEIEKQAVIEKLAAGYYIILTGNKYHLSSMLVKVLTLLTTGKWPKYTHVLMNVDFMDQPEQVDQFKFVEATAAGVHFSTFNEIVDCTNICILDFKNINNSYYTEVIDYAIRNIGKPYDDLFDMSNDQQFSCVELVRNALMRYPWYKEAFANFENMITKEGTLIPQMFKDCKDFMVVLER